MRAGVALLAASRRQLGRGIALTLSALCASAIVVVGIALLFSAERQSLLAYGALLLLALLGSGATALLVQRQPLVTAMLPLVTALAVGICLSAYLFPSTALVTAPLLVLIVLLVSLTQDQHATRIAMLAAALLGAAIGVTAPAAVPVVYGFQIQAIAPLIQAIGVVTLIVVVWYVNDQLIASQEHAIALADAQATDVQRANAALELRSAEVEQRNAELERLLALVQRLELPVLFLGDHTLVMPLVGTLDTARLAALRQRLLRAVHQERASVLILDLTGVSLADHAVIAELTQLLQAVQLLGTRTIMCGITGEVARTLIAAPVAPVGVKTVATLGEAIAARVSAA